VVYSAWISASVMTSNTVLLLLYWSSGIYAVTRRRLMFRESCRVSVFPPWSLAQRTLGWTGGNTVASQACLLSSNVSALMQANKLEACLTVTSNGVYPSLFRDISKRFAC
jgi:hypothetical protein